MRHRHTLAALIAIGVAAGFAVAPAAAQQDARTGSVQRIGAAAAVQGEVQLAALPGVRPVGTEIASGEPIYLGDRVTTGPAGRLQVLLLDETLFTIGPNAALVIDSFVYDPSTSQGKVAATVVKGAFRFITGKVARLNPSDMEVKLPVGSIGVRGTSVAGVTDGVSATIVLLGPGPDTDTGERIGRILVRGSGDAAAAPVEISRPGFATEITAINQPPLPPVRLEPARLAALTAPLSGSPPPPPGAGAGERGPPPSPNGAPPQNGGQGPVPPPNGAAPRAPGPAAPLPGAGPIGGTGGLSQLSGAGLAGGLQGVSSIGALQPVLFNAQMLTQQQAQGPQVPPDTTTFEQLRSINQGVAHFAPQTVPMSGMSASGSYTIVYSYDFSSRTANGQVTINAGAGFTMTGSGTFPLLAEPFATGTGPVVIHEAGINVPGAIGGIADVTYKFRNANSLIFSALDHSVTYSQGQTVSGSGTTPRQ